MRQFISVVIMYGFSSLYYFLFLECNKTKQKTICDVTKNLEFKNPLILKTFLWWKTYKMLTVTLETPSRNINISLQKASMIIHFNNYTFFFFIHLLLALHYVPVNELLL